MTSTRAGLLGLAAVSTTATALLARVFVQALRDIDVELDLDPLRPAPRTAPRPTTPATVRS